MSLCTKMAWGRTLPGCSHGGMEESDHERVGWDAAKKEAKEERFGVALVDRWSRGRGGVGPD